MFLHEMDKFKEFIETTAKDMGGLGPSLVEKDYWIMHCLWGLQDQGFEFFMKGGTSLSKGFKIIDRFSEDIDILIVPPEDMDVKTGKNHDKKPAHLESRAKFYDYLADTIKIPGIVTVERDREFDDDKLRNGGIRLHYNSLFDPIEDLKDGVLLEVGFAKVTPNEPVDISSWLIEKTVELNKLADFNDNRAVGVKCYNPEYTFVEKLSAISFKYKKQQRENKKPANFLRHYYDVYQLLEQKRVQDFIATKEYREFKNSIFQKVEERDLTKDDAFIIKNDETKKEFEESFDKTRGLYYKDRPSLKEILSKFEEHLPKL